MATIKYQSPFKPYPFIDSDEVTHTSTNSDDFVVAVGDCVQQKGTDKVFRLVCFDNTASADVDFTIACFVITELVLVQPVNPAIIQPPF